MNYEARIAKMQADGILKEEEAKMLKKSLKESSATIEPKQRNYRLEGVAILFFALLILFFLIQTEMTTSDTSIENVSLTLNQPRAGIGTFQTFSLILFGFGIIAFIGFYTLVHHYYNGIWKLQEHLKATGTLIADLETRKSKMEESIQKFSTEKQGAKSALHILDRMDRELGELQQEFAYLQARCRQKKGKFPYSLAALTGGLPSCQ